MIQFVSQSPGEDEYISDILSGEYYIMGNYGIQFKVKNNETRAWTVFVGTVVTDSDGPRYWIRIDGIDYKVELTDTVESYLNRIRVPLHNATMNDTLDELD